MPVAMRHGMRMQGRHDHAALILVRAHACTRARVRMRTAACAVRTGIIACACAWPRRPGHGLSRPRARLGSRVVAAARARATRLHKRPPPPPPRPPPRPPPPRTDATRFPTCARARPHTSAASSACADRVTDGRTPPPPPPGAPPPPPPRPLPRPCQPAAAATAPAGTGARSRGGALVTLLPGGHAQSHPRLFATTTRR